RDFPSFPTRRSSDLLLAAEGYAAVRVDAQFGAAAVHVVRGERTLHGVPGELISLFAVHGPASGVVSDGLVYPLRGETLEPGSTRDRKSTRLNSSHSQ